MLLVILVPHECSLGTRERTLAVFTIWYLTSFLKPILEMDAGKPRGKKLLYILLRDFFQLFYIALFSDAFAAVTLRLRANVDYSFNSKIFVKHKKAFLFFKKLFTAFGAQNY